MKSKGKSLVSMLGSVLLAGSLLAPLNSQASGPIAEDHFLSHETTEKLYDARNVLRKVMPSEAQIKAADVLIQTAGSGVKLQWDTNSGTPSIIVKDGGYLSSPSEGDAGTIARQWLKKNAALYGLTSAEMDDLKVTRNYKMPGTGLQPVTFQQTYNGLESVYGGRVIVAVNKEGRVLTVTGNLSRSKQLAGDFKLTSADALQKALSIHVPAAQLTSKLLKKENGWDVFDGGKVLPTVQRVKKAAFIEENGVRPVFRVLLVKKLDEAFEVIIDGVSGERLYERSLVEHLEPAGTVFENYPGAPMGGIQVKKSFKGDPGASPNGWLLPANELGVTTLGNNANTYANWSNFLAPVDQIIRPVAPLGQFNYPFLNSWQKTNGQTVPPSYADDVNSAATSLFYHHNVFHDYYYNLGWTENAGNLQASNYGKGGAEGDPILGLVQAGAVSGGDPTFTGRDNAYMLTLPDGLPAWSGMFLWEPIKGAFNGAYADGDYDAGVIYHEYSHALSSRLVAGGESLGSHQAGSMGEAWGDWYGMHYLVKKGLQEKPIVGAYVTDNAERGIRSWALDDSPLNYGDVGFDVGGPEVHSDGEIWAAILWDVREALIEHLGREKGEQVIEQLVIDAMPISAPNPSMVDMRTAIITADFERFGGEHSDILWSSFGKRGLGADAFSNGGDDTDPIPAFNHPNKKKNGNLAGVLINAATNKPIENARIIVGKFEARTSAAVTTGQKGQFALPMVEGAYDITIQAKGFGSRTLKNVRVTAGKNNVARYILEPNAASYFNGAAAASTSESDSSPVKNAIDDTEASVFATGTEESGFSGAEITVDLAGDQPVTVSHLEVSAFKDISKGRFATIKDFTVQTSLDGESWKTVAEDQFTAQKPRPAAPDLHYKGLDLAQPVQAKFVKLIAKTAQDDAAQYVQIAELQVFASGKSKIEPVTLEPESPFITEGTVKAGNAGTGVGSLAGLPATLAVTENEFVTTKNPTPASQGVDGYVITLPEAHGDGIHTFTLEGQGDSASYDYDVYFYNKDFELIGSAASSGANESGVIPGGTKYVYAGLYSGANVPFTFTSNRPY
ncbi:M36 family metallopeptidase [Peribacillus sp. SCS-37]|uniref:M36 family metallopeptidase n=1 Tax=Paraperibacillus esterisolvens TaxID=3115296 RepID=UPI003905BD9E